MKLALLIGKQRGACIFHSSENHLKAISHLYDQVQDTLLQYVDFLANNMVKEAFRAIMPSLDRLCGFYSLEPEVAWFISRSALPCVPNLLVAKNDPKNDNAGNAKDDSNLKQVNTDSTTAMDVDSSGPLEYDIFKSWYETAVTPVLSIVRQALPEHVTTEITCV
jgi:THO complex subunit 2